MVKNNTHEKTAQHDILRLSVWILGSSPVCAGLHLIKSFNLDHLNWAALFTRLHLGNATTCAAVLLPTSSCSRVPDKATGKTSCILSILLCRQQWRGRSYFVQSGTVRFGFCSWWSFVFPAQQKLRSPAGHVSQEISGVDRNYCWNSKQVNPHRDLREKFLDSGQGHPGLQVPKVGGCVAPKDPMNAPRSGRNTRSRGWNGIQATCRRTARLARASLQTWKFLGSKWVTSRRAAAAHPSLLPRGTEGAPGGTAMMRRKSGTPVRLRVHTLERSWARWPDAERRAPNCAGAERSGEPPLQGRRN